LGRVEDAEVKIADLAVAAVLELEEAAWDHAVIDAVRARVILPPEHISIE
jgi:hypothetical protein